MSNTPSNTAVDIADLLPRLRVLQVAAEGDSNDKEIALLRDALDAAVDILIDMGCPLADWDSLAPTSDDFATYEATRSF